VAPDGGAAGSPRRRRAAALEHWLMPGFDTPFRLVPDTDGIEALSEDVSAKWKRVTEADFLSDAEKRRLVGVAKEE
jgi:phage portal protein BeeE